MNPRGVRLYGAGFRFAPGLTPGASVALSSGPENIRESLEVIVATEPGERIMRPEFGTGLREFLHEPNTTATHRLIQERITRAVQRWEPRVRLDSVAVAGDRQDARRAIAEIRYRLVATGETAALAVGVAVDQGLAAAGGSR